MFNYRRVYPVDRVRNNPSTAFVNFRYRSCERSCGHNTFYPIDAAITETIEVWSPYWRQNCCTAGTWGNLTCVGFETLPAMSKGKLHISSRVAPLQRFAPWPWAATSCPAAGGYGVRLPPRERLGLNPRSSQSHTSRQLEPGHIERSL